MESVSHSSLSAGTDEQLKTIAKFHLNLEMSFPPLELDFPIQRHRQGACSPTGIREKTSLTSNTAESISVSGTEARRVSGFGTTRWTSAVWALSSRNSCTCLSRRLRLLLWEDWSGKFKLAIIQTLKKSLLTFPVLVGPLILSGLVFFYRLHSWFQFSFYRTHVALSPQDSQSPEQWYECT